MMVVSKFVSGQNEYADERPLNYFQIFHAFRDYPMADFSGEIYQEIYEILSFLTFLDMISDVCG